MENNTINTISQARVVLTLLNDTIRCEENVRKLAARVERSAQRVAHDLDTGGSLNSLGELQGSGPGFDVAIAELTTVRRSAWTVAGMLDGWAEDLADDDVSYARYIADRSYWAARFLAERGVTLPS